MKVLLLYIHSSKPLCSTCIRCFLTPVNHLSAVCGFGQLFFYVAGFLFSLCCVCAVLLASCPPHLHVCPRCKPLLVAAGLGCSARTSLCFRWFFFFFSVKRGVVCTWTLLYDSYGPPSPPDSIGMQIKCPSPVSAAPPSLLHPTITYMHTLYTLHVACMSRVNTVTFDRLGTSFCSFLCLPSLSIALRYFLSSYCAVVVFVRQLSELLFVSFYLSFLQWRHLCFSFHLWVFL